MSAATNLLKSGLDTSAFCVRSYLEDLSDSDLLIRPAKNANHIAWQLGHLIVSEHDLINMVCPGAMPDLPAGFSQRYTPNTATSDNPQNFHTKDVYLRLMNEQRSATMAALEKLTDQQLDQAAPEAIRSYAPTVAATFLLQATHWMMHSGQWVIVRRQLGRAPLF
jgi:uncharacterized damage-inducible protein DinB